MHDESSFFDALWVKKVPFLVVFFVIFTLTYGVLFAVDFLPEPKTSAPVKAVATSTFATTTKEVEEVSPAAMAEEPVQLSIPSLDRVVSVLNPETRDIVELDRELLKGVVRHPDSALLGEEGNVVILGHSSYLPNVMNKNFQALNGIQKMKWGDIITLQSDGTEYTYRVEKVYQAKASGVTIPTEVTGKRLTLVTCNSFGAKEDRFIVEAKLLSEKAL
ncbi:MAG: sortase domain-bontaining protein [Candidatus Paceibacteria bacterium]